MNSYLDIFPLIGVLIGLIGGAGYTIDTLKGKTKPNRVSWLMWMISPLIASIAAFSAGVRWAAIPTFASSLVPLSVLIASFINKKSYWKLETFDYFCGIFSVIGLILWYLIKQPEIAILFAILSDLMASAPTLIKIWHHPETESANAYIGGVIANATAFAVITSWSFAEVAFPTYLVVICLIFVGLIYRKNSTK